MQSRVRLLFCFVAAVFLLAACSSTTVVASDDRAAPDEDASAGADADDNEAPTADDSDTEDQAPERAGDDDAAQDDDPLTPRQLEEAEGFGLGGAEQLNGLLVDCETGNDLACDILFQLSDFDSIEEAAALTCGGRSDTEVLFCTEGIEAQPEQLVFAENSTGLDAVVDLCETDADMTACDFLYFRSPIDSEYEEIGATCGGRVDLAVPDCRTFLTE